MAEIFLTFLRLGCLSFGGPVAHLGYFRRELVERRQWCSEQRYAETVALAQTLPGPASSQVGFALGILRGGLPGGLAAWLGFTTPSAALMLLFAWAGETLAANRFWLPTVHALQLVAVGVVAQAVLAMRKSLAPDWKRLSIALAIAAFVLFGRAGGAATLAGIALGAVCGLILLRRLPSPAGQAVSADAQIPHLAAIAAGSLFALLLGFSSLAGAAPTPANTAAAFYRSGALVFGGGHVVLPLLESSVVQPGWVSQQTFLAGYAAAQAVPGPLFTFAAYLGASVRPASHPLLSGLLALVAIFLPGLLLIVAVLPYWTRLAAHPLLAPAIRGIHAAVVGVLLAALIRPVGSSTIHTPLDLGLVVAAFAALLLRTPPWLLVPIYAGGAVAVTLAR